MESLEEEKRGRERGKKKHRNQRVLQDVGVGTRPAPAILLARLHAAGSHTSPHTPFSKSSVWATGSCGGDLHLRTRALVARPGTDYARSEFARGCSLAALRSESNSHPCAPIHSSSFFLSRLFPCSARAGAPAQVGAPHSARHSALIRIFCLSRWAVSACDALLPHRLTSMWLPTETMSVVGLLRHYY